MIRHPSFAWRAALLLCVLHAAPVCHAAITVDLEPVADTTLIENAPNNNLGAAWFFNAGTTATGFRNHGLLRFDLAGAIPAGSILQSAELTLTVIREPAAGRQDSVFGLYRALRPWGEGDKSHGGTPFEPISPGLGSPAGPNDATWLHRFAFTAETWALPGGQAGVDFFPAASSARFVQGVNESPYTFPSTAELVADAQAWLVNPQVNFGWMLISDGESEGINTTARSFGSREHENPFFRPHLLVTFEPVPEPATLALLSVAVLGWLACRLHRRR
jgi:hypothetical protein